jgi:hypothetical protein
VALAMYAAHDNNFIFRPYIKDTVREAPQNRPVQPATDPLILLRVPMDRSYGRIDGTEEVDTETNVLLLVPIRGFGDLRSRLEPEDQSSHL